MSASFTLAVDAMGGDHAPDIVVAGLSIAAERHPAARFLLVGDEPRLRPLLERYARAAKVCTVRHAPDAIGGDMKPTAALRMRNASMRVAIDAVAAGEARSSSRPCRASTGRRWRPSVPRPAVTWSCSTLAPT